MDESKKTITDKVKEFYKGYDGPTGFRYGSEMITVTERWEKTGLLRNLDPYPASQIAMLMENQRLMKELIKQDPSQYDMNMDSAQLFLDGQMTAVRRIYDPRFFVGFDLVSVQTLLGPAGLVRFLKLHFKNKDTPKAADDTSLQQVATAPDQEPDTTIEWKLDNEDWCAKTRKLKTFLNFQKPDSKSYNERLEAGAYAIGKMSWDITQEINREILTDIRNNVGTIGTLEKYDGNPENLYCKIIELSGVIWRKTMLHKPNWIVTNPKISAELQRYGSFTEADEILTFDGTPGVHKMGQWCSFNLYEDPLFPNSILIGYKSPTNEYNAGYFYGPYIPLTATPRIVDPEFCPRPGLLTRYAKKLLRFGAKFYGRIDIKDGLSKE